MTYEYNEYTVGFKVDNRILKETTKAPRWWDAILHPLRYRRSKRLSLFWREWLEGK